MAIIICNGDHDVWLDTLGIIQMIGMFFFDNAFILFACSLDLAAANELRF